MAEQSALNDTPQLPHNKLSRYYTVCLRVSGSFMGKWAILPAAAAIHQTSIDVPRALSCAHELTTSWSASSSGSL